MAKKLVVRSLHNSGMTTSKNSIWTSIARFFFNTLVASSSLEVLSQVFISTAPVCQGIRSSMLDDRGPGLCVDTMHTQAYKFNYDFIKNISSMFIFTHCWRPRMSWFRCMIHRLSEFHTLFQQNFLIFNVCVCQIHVILFLSIHIGLNFLVCCALPAFFSFSKRNNKVFFRIHQKKIRHCSRFYFRILTLMCTAQTHTHRTELM